MPEAKALLLEQLLAAAAAHGECSDPEHEVGDLQEVLSTCFSLLTLDQARAVFEAHRHLLEWLEEEASR